MNCILMKKCLIQLAAWSGVVLFCAATAVAQQPAAAAAQGQRTDGQIEMDVIHALDASPQLKNDLITAATIQSEVTLSGTVSSDASKHLAESIASRVNGVTRVHNNLKIGNPADADAQADNEEMPDADQSQAEQGMENLPPSAPSPDQYPEQGQTAQAQPAYPPQAPYPQQGSAYPPQRPQYQSPNGQQPARQYPPAAPAYEMPAGPVTLAPGTMLQVRTSEPVDSKRARDGQPVQFVVIQDVTMGGVLAIPRGAVVHGVVTQSQNVGSGQMAGNSTLGLTLTSLDLGGRNYPLSTDEFRVKGPNKAGQTVGGALTGGLLGTIIGCAAGGGAGCAIGAGTGVAAGTAAGAAASGPRAWIPAEALVTFHLNTPLTVQPVNAQEAARLAQGLYPGGPTLYRRPPMGPRYYAGYPYPYPPVYYRPYFMVGGAYYWR